MAQLGKPSDRPALNRIQEAFPNCEVYPIKHAQTLTRLGVGLRDVSWNTLLNGGSHNAKYFVPSRRHPFNPFDEEAFTEGRLRAVLEHDLKRRLDNEEWGAFNEAFSVYWNNLFDSDGLFSPDDIFHSIKEELRKEDSPYFFSDKELTNVVDILVRYMMHVPRLILQDNVEDDIVDYFRYIDRH